MWWMGRGLVMWLGRRHSRQRPTQLRSSQRYPSRWYSRRHCRTCGAPDDDGEEDKATRGSKVLDGLASWWVLQPGLVQIHVAWARWLVRPSDERSSQARPSSSSSILPIPFQRSHEDHGKTHNAARRSNGSSTSSSWRRPILNPPKRRRPQLSGNRPPGHGWLQLGRQRVSL